MKIQTIDIKNFLALEQATLNLQAPINIIAGANEAGKSSIQGCYPMVLNRPGRGSRPTRTRLLHDPARGQGRESPLPWRTARPSSARKPPDPAGVTGPSRTIQVMVRSFVTP